VTERDDLSLELNSVTLTDSGSFVYTTSAFVTPLVRCEMALGIRFADDALVFVEAYRKRRGSFRFRTVGESHAKGLFPDGFDSPEDIFSGSRSHRQMIRMFVAEADRIPLTRPEPSDDKRIPCCRLNPPLGDEIIASIFRRPAAAPDQ